MACVSYKIDYIYKSHLKGGEPLMSTFDKVKAIVVEQLGVDEAEVTMILRSSTTSMTLGYR